METAPSHCKDPAEKTSIPYAAKIRLGNLQPFVPPAEEGSGYTQPTLRGTGRAYALKLLGS